MNVTSSFARTARCAVVLTAFVLSSIGLVASAGGTEPAAATDGWTVPDIAKLPDNAWGRLVREGRELTVATYAHLGPDIADAVASGSSSRCPSTALMSPTIYVRIISFWSTGLGLRKVSICRDLMRPTNAGLLTQAL